MGYFHTHSVHSPSIRLEVPNWTSVLHLKSLRREQLIYFLIFYISTAVKSPCASFVTFNLHVLKSFDEVVWSPVQNRFKWNETQRRRICAHRNVRNIHLAKNALSDCTAKGNIKNKSNIQRNQSPIFKQSTATVTRN